MADAAKRIPQLVDAVLSVTSSLTLPVVLREIVEAARSLVGARYAALGVIGDDPWLSDFIHTGMDEELVARMAHLPQGKGVLRQLITDPRPLRLADLREHPAAHGFPDGHPVMTSFLGAPIRVDGHAYGNLYLTDKDDAAEFSADDEELVVALASVAGAAIHNARLHDQQRQERRWLAAARGVTAALLDSQGLDDILEQVAWHARDLAAADVATIALPAGDDLLRVRVALGAHAASLRGQTIPRENSISGEVLRTGRAVVLGDAAADPRGSQPLVRDGRFGPTMVVPLGSEGSTFGTLLIANLRDGPAFGPADRALVGSLAEQASVAVEYHRAQDSRRRLLILEERERIGRDLQTTVISRLSSTGWSLERAATRVRSTEPAFAQELMQLVDDLDDSMRQMRTMVFGNPPGPGIRPGA